jgi:hypothetical protein
MKREEMKSRVDCRAVSDFNSAMSCFKMYNGFFSESRIDQQAVDLLSFILKS